MLKSQAYFPDAEEKAHILPRSLSLSVVGGQYCLPKTWDLTIAKKVLSFAAGEFTISAAESGELLLHVDGHGLAIQEHRVIRDANGKPLLFACRKLISLHDSWTVYRSKVCGEGAVDAEEELFTVRKSKVVQLGTALDVFLASSPHAHEKKQDADYGQHTKHHGADHHHHFHHHDADFYIKGNYFERDCVITTHDHQVVAQVKRKPTSADNVGMEKNTFCVSLNHMVDYVFIATLIVIMDEMHTDD